MDCKDCQAGVFIAIEGIDGSGTTIQNESLSRALIKLGYSVVKTAEPTDHLMGVVIREALRGQRHLCPNAMALLFAADRAEHANEIESMVKKGFVVTCDRYVWSSYAYQGIATGDPDWIDAINSRSLKPDLVVYCKVDPYVAAERRESRGEGSELYDMMEMQHEVASEYDCLADESKRQNEILGSNAEISPVLVVDASRSILEIHHDILKGVEQLLADRGVMPHGGK